MQNQVSTPDLILKEILTELVDTGNEFAGAVLHLAKAVIALGPTTDVADFTECDFTGYAASSTIVWGTPFYPPGARPVVLGDEKTFIVGSPATVLNTVYAWYITNAAGTKYLFGKILDTPVVLSAAGQGFSILPSYPAYAPV